MWPFKKKPELRTWIIFHDESNADFPAKQVRVFDGFVTCGVQGTKNFIVHPMHKIDVIFNEVAE